MAMKTNIYKVKYQTKNMAGITSTCYVACDSVKKAVDIFTGSEFDEDSIILDVTRDSDQLLIDSN